jgi:peptidoglycan/LPS O-acetylase OafA/YrhL
MVSIKESNKIFGLDFLRAVAILLVFLWHYRRYGMPEWLTGISTFGWTGVDLFFVLSGFLIGGQLFEKVAIDNSISLSKFYTKRFFRILPAYFVVLSLYFLIPSFSEREGMSEGWKFWTFTMNFGLDYQNAGSFSHAWSLCIEEQFYLFLPIAILSALAFKIGKRYILWALLALFIFGFIIRAYSWQTYVSPLHGDENQMALIGNTYSKYIYYPSYNRLDGLLVGLLIALSFTFKPEIKAKLLLKSDLFMVLGLLVLIGTYFISKDQFAFQTAVFSYPLVSAGYGLILVSCLSPTSKIQKIKFKFFPFLAVLSYSFYLLHKQINHITVNILSEYELNKTILLLICFFCSLLAAILLHILVERPFLLVREKILEKNWRTASTKRLE